MSRNERIVSVNGSSGYIADEKPAGKTKANRSEWERLRAEKLIDPRTSANRPCRASRLCGRRAETLHHLVGGIRRSDVPANLIPVCGHGTRGCHGVLTSRNRDGETGLTWPEVAREIRATMLHEELEHVVAEISHDGLNRLYPGKIGNVGEAMLAARKEGSRC